MKTDDGSPRQTRVALIGAGAIGTGVAARLAGGGVPGLEATGFLVRTPGRELSLRTYGGLDELLADDPDVVVEAAGREAVFAHAERCLRAGKDLVVASGGALGDEPLRQALISACSASGARMLL